MSSIQENHDAELDARLFPELETLTPAELTRLSQGCELLDFAADVPVVSEDQQSGALYLVQSGALRVNKRHNNQVHKVGDIVSGNIFGEASILFGAQANSEVRTVEPCSLIKIRMELVDKLLTENSGFRCALMKLAEQRIAANALMINPVLSALPTVLKEILILNTQYKSLALGEILFREGNSECGTMYLITGGKAEASVQHPSIAGQKTILGRYHAGDILGDRSDVRDGKYIATATAISELHLMRIDNSAPEIWGARFSKIKAAAEADFNRKRALFRSSAERPMSFSGNS